MYASRPFNTRQKIIYTAQKTPPTLLPPLASKIGDKNIRIKDQILYSRPDFLEFTDFFVRSETVDFKQLSEIDKKLKAIENC